MIPLKLQDWERDKNVLSVQCWGHAAEGLKLQLMSGMLVKVSNVNEISQWFFTISMIQMVSTSAFLLLKALVLSQF